MKAIVGFLNIKREERLPVGLFFVWQLLLQALAITKNPPLFTNPSNNYYKLFVDNYHLSGFDPLTYLVVSDWSLAFDVNRHPLLALFYYPFFVVKQIAHLYYGNKLCHLYSCMCFAILLCRWFCSYVAYFAPNHRHIFFRFSASCLLSLFFCSRFTFKYSPRPFHFVDVYAFAYAIYCRKAHERKERNGHLANCFVVFAYCRYISE